MVEYRADQYGESFADVYDDWYAHVSDVDATVRTVTAMARGPRVLELGVGTGRIALALARVGCEVVGIDASASMLQRLSRNDPVGIITAVEADMADFSLGRSFDAALIAFNTLFNLVSLDAQRSCLACVGSHLVPGGLLFVEAVVPGAAPSRRGLEAGHLEDGGLVLTATITDAVTRITRGNHVHIGADGSVRLRPWAILPTSPNEMDDMAEAAGLELVHRYGDWAGHPFDEDSTTPVSVYRRSH